jgi:hypothetical protein
MIDLHPQSAEGQCSRLGYAPYPFCYCYRFVKRGGNGLPQETRPLMAAAGVLAH